MPAATSSGHKHMFGFLRTPGRLPAAESGDNLVVRAMFLPEQEACTAPTRPYRERGARRSPRLRHSLDHR